MNISGIRRHSVTRLFFLHSLRTHLLYLLLPLFLFFTTTIGVTFYYQSNQAQSTLRTTFQLLEDYTGNLFTQSDSLVLTFHQSNTYARASTLMKNEYISYQSAVALKYISEQLHSIADASQLIESVYVYTRNNNGRFLSSVSGLNLLDAFYDTGWYDEYATRAPSNDTWVSRRRYARYDPAIFPPTDVLTIYRSIMNGRCLVVMNVYTSQMLENAHSSFVYDRQETMLVQADGSVLLSTSDAPGFPVDKYFPLTSGAASPILGQSEGYFYSIKPIWNGSVHLVVAIPYSEVFRVVIIQLAAFGLMLLLCVVLCLVLAYRFADRERKKLQALYNLVETNILPTGPVETVKPYDIYSHIEQNIVSFYVRQSTLEIELQKKDYEMKSMELLALQAQINPHFLINTLSTIFWMTLGLTDGTMNPACGMLDDLSELLGLLTGNPNEPISLETEVKCLRNYISIQKRRYAGRFEYTEDIDPRCPEIPIAKLLIQPIVENCLVHAMPNEGILHIALTVRLAADHLEILVRDDGVGIPPEEMRSLTVHLQQSAAYAHIGLYNTMKRLMLLYDLPSPLTIESGETGGTAVTLRIPLSKLEEQNPKNKGE